MDGQDAIDECLCACLPGFGMLQNKIRKAKCTFRGHPMSIERRKGFVRAFRNWRVFSNLRLRCHAPVVPVCTLEVNAARLITGMENSSASYR